MGVHMAILQFRIQFHSRRWTYGSEQETLEAGLKFYDKWWGNLSNLDSIQGHFQIHMQTGFKWGTLR